MKWKTSFFVTLAVLALGLGGLVYGTWKNRMQTRSVLVLKLAHGLDNAHPVHKAMEFMDRRLRELSGGTMQIQIFPNEQLGSERVVIEQLQLGCVDMTKASCASLESFIPEMGVFSLPYIFRDRGHYWRVLDGEVGQQFLDLGKGKGLRGLCYYDSGSRSFYMKDGMIRTPEDLVGKKIRVMPSKTSMAMVRALGGSPTPIDWGELYTSLQQGVVDGAENNPPSLHVSRHFEVCRFYSLDEHSMIPDIMLISRVVWNKLTPPQQQWLQTVAEESSQFQRTLWQEKTAESLAAVQAAGVEVFTPDKAPFVAKVKELLDSYKGSPIGDAVQKIMEVE